LFIFALVEHNMRPDGIQEPPRASTLTDTPTTDEPVAVSATVHEIVVGHTRLRVERDCATGEHAYFVNDQRCDVNAYLAVTQAHHDRAEPLRQAVCHPSASRFQT
jgi:hypothetical protein